MAYHAGVLKALHEHGLDLVGADFVVGTSAGAIMAAYMAAGWSPSDFYDYAHGLHPDSGADGDAQEQEIDELFRPLYRSSVSRAARGVGSAFAAISARGVLGPLLRGRKPPAFLRKAFPSGLFATDGTRSRFAADLPAEWPRTGLCICAVDLYTGERIAYGAPGSPPAMLPEAVLASTSIPGLFPPVRIGGRQMVDGGIYSATSLDLAVDAGAGTILCVAPLGYRREDEKGLDLRSLPPRLVRTPFARGLRKEVSDARSRGIDVLAIRPTLKELKQHGTNSMRHADRAAITDAAVESTNRMLDANPSHPVIEAFKRTRRSTESIG